MSSSSGLTFADLAQAAVRKYFRQAVKYEAAVLADRDPEDLHQMRVGMRRLRTAIHAFGPGLVLPKAAREKRIAAAGRCLGALRDLDVIQANLTERYLGQLPETEQLLMIQVFKRLGKQRRKRYKQVQKLLQGKQYRQLKQGLTDWLAQPSYQLTANLPATAVLPDLALPLVSQLWLHPGWLVGTELDAKGQWVPQDVSGDQLQTLLATEADTVHDLRKQVKRARYQLKLLTDFYPKRVSQAVDDFAEIQETLGEVQDSHVLQAFLAAEVGDVAQELPTLHHRLTEVSQTAWSAWQQLQRPYLVASKRSGLRRALLSPQVQLPPDTADQVDQAASQQAKSQKKGGKQAKKSAAIASQAQANGKAPAAQDP